MKTIKLIAIILFLLSLTCIATVTIIFDSKSECLKGNAKSCAYLARRQELKDNKIEARKWYKLACDKGYKQVCTKLESLK